MTDTPPPVVPPILPLRFLVRVVAGGLVLLGIFAFGILKNGDYPPIWVPWALGGLAMVSHRLSQTVGFNLKPVPAGTLPGEAMAMAAAAFQASTVLRFALTEGVAIVALVLSFAITPASWMTYLIGAVLSLVLLRVNVWPSAAVISKAQQRLDREGGESFLGDALLGVAPGTASSGIISSF